MTKPNKLSLGDADKLIASHTSDNMRDRVLAFIIEYQAKHTGNTPTVDVIARHLDTVPQAVKAMLGRLEVARKIHTVSRNPLRVVIMEKDTLLPHEEADNAKPADPERYSRLLEADGTRHGLARWIAQHNRDYGRGPSLREAMTHLNLTNGSWVNRQLEILSERGLIQYGNGQNTQLTAAGERFYGLAKPSVVVVPFTPKEKEMPKKEYPRESHEETVARRLSLPSSAYWADRAGRFIYEYQRDRRDMSPEYKDIRAALGVHNDTTVAVALKVLEREGLIQPRPKSSKRTVFLTEEGKRRFGPQQSDAWPEEDRDTPPMPEPEPDLPPKPEPAPAWRSYDPPAPPTAAPSLSNVATPDLIMELIERGYTVKR